MKNKFFLRVTGIVLACTMLISATVSSFAVNSDNIQINKEDLKISSEMKSKNDFNNEIKTLEKGLVRANDGTLTLTVTPQVAKQLNLSDEHIKKYQSGLDNLNKRIKKCELVSTENFTIYEKNDKDFVIQGGVDYFAWYWWGGRSYYCSYCCPAAVSAYTKLGIGFGVGGSVLGITPWGIICIFSSATFFCIANDINYVSSQNNSRGVILDTNWAMYYTCYSQ